MVQYNKNMKNKYITACNTCKQSKMKAEMIQQAEGYKCIPCNKKKYEIAHEGGEKT